jgi:mono/diheme cytochrome c family protein
MWNSNHLVLAAACFLCAGIAGIAQEKPNSGQSDGVYSELRKAPEKMKAKENPLSKDPEARAAGEILFAEHCQECHGVHGEGGRKAPSLRAAEVQEASDGTIFWILSNGIVRKRMPVWSKLPEPQRWQLVSYIKSLAVTETDEKMQAKP